MLEDDCVQMYQIYRVCYIWSTVPLKKATCTFVFVPLLLKMPGRQCSIYEKNIMLFDEHLYFVSMIIISICTCLICMRSQVYMFIYKCIQKCTVYNTYCVYTRVVKRIMR